MYHRLRDRAFAAATISLSLLLSSVAAAVAVEPAARDFASQVTSESTNLVDYTDKLHAVAGLVITVPIWGAHWQNGEAIGDFDNVFTITQSNPKELSVDYSFSAPASIRGSRLVNEADLKNSHKIQVYFSENGKGDYEPGSTPYIRISDDLFQSIKSGKATKFELDAEANSPKTIKLVATEKLPVLVDEHEGIMRVMKAECDNGWIFWILDNPEFPIVVKGQLDFKFGQPMFSHADITGKEIVKELSLGKEVTTHAVLFGFNSAQLNPESKPVLTQITDYLKHNPKDKLEIQGHTDNVGTAQQNLELSKRRALAVKEFICEGTGVEPQRLVTEGLGLTKPIADNTTATGRQRNRRVIFKIIQ